VELTFPFNGNWLVNFNHTEFNYPDILILLAHIQDKFNEIGTNFNSITINFNKNDVKNYYFKENNDILLSFSGLDRIFEEKESKPCEPAVMKPLKKAIKTISLLFPRLENDPRWKTMGLPAGQLFLAANLEANGFAVTPESFSLPGENPPVEALSADMTGFSLFEDLLPFLGPFLAHFRASGKGILAAGGPFPTLAPLAAIYHLPQVNLWVRGEAELALPRILKALNEGDAGAFFSQEGVFWQQPGVIAIAGFDRVNRPRDFSALAFDLDFLKPRHFAHGLEMNFSRGCRRGCIFCCRAQGTKFRKLPLEKAEELLKEYRKKVDNLNEACKSPRPLSGPPPLPKGGDRRDFDLVGMMNQTPTNENLSSSSPLTKGEELAFTVNINDDDILQDPGYAREIFSLLKRKGLRIFGVQTSTASLVRGDGSLNLEVLNLIADPELFVEDRPLLWLGTDTFLPSRARRLGKRLPSLENFRTLLGEIEKRGLRHFHYWISSDNESSWEEFVDEMGLIIGFFREFPGFGLLAHAPFVVPYPSSRLFQRLAVDDPQLKTKLILDAPDSRFRYAVVERLETRWPNLNRLLSNEKAGGESGFLDLLKAKDFMAAAQLAYHFLKQEELQSTEIVPNLYQAKVKLEEVIGKNLV
jgi:hypothetical protein